MRPRRRRGRRRPCRRPRGGGQPSERDGAGDGGEAVLAAVVQRGQLGADHADDQCVDADLRGPLHGHGGRQVLQTRLGRSVGGRAGRGSSATDAADHHDRAPGAAQVLVGCQRGGQRGDKVQLDDPGMPLGVRVGQPPVRGAAGVVDEHVEPGKRPEEGADRGRIAQVEGDELHAVERLFGRTSGAGQHLGAGCGEGPCDARPDSPGATGDDDGSAAQRVVHRPVRAACGVLHRPACGACGVFHRTSRSSSATASFEASHLTNVWWKGVECEGS